MDYNKVDLRILFYIFIWKRVVKAYSKLLAVTYSGWQRDIDELISKGVTPVSLARWYFKKGITYQEEKIDNIKTPARFLSDKGGDCDDFTEFAYHVLTARMFNCRRMYVWGESGFHVALLVNGVTQHWIMDTTNCEEVSGIHGAISYFKDEGFENYLIQ